MNKLIEANKKYFEKMKSRLDVLKKIRVLQKSLINVSFKSDQDRSKIYSSILNSIEIEKASLLKINQIKSREKNEY